MCNSSLSSVLRPLLSIFVAALLLISGCQSNGLFKGSPKESAQDLLTRADALYKTRQLDQSALVYDQVLQSDPANVIALYRMGNIAFRQQNLDLASSFYRQVISADPRHSKAHYNLAMANLSLAEKHLKFYTATADENTDMKLATEIVGFLNGLSGGGASQQEAQSTSLDILTEQLLGK